MFKKFFKKNGKVQKDDSIASKFDWLINEALLTFNNGDCFMHYYDKNTKKNKQDPSWQNQGIFFWKADELFEKKSLPDTFLNFEKMTFMINQIPEYVTFRAGKAIPWFGKPGGGDKFFFDYQNTQITLEEAKEMNVIFYCNEVVLNQDNLHILKDRDHYFFKISSNIKFIDKEFYLNESKISLSELYKLGLLKVFEIVR